MIESIDDLIVFLKHFHRNLLEDPSLPPEQIPNDLPEGLAKIYRELGGLLNIGQPGPFGRQDWLLPIRQLKYIDGMVEFCWEAQCVWSARCQSNEKDPPVYSDYSTWNDWNVEEEFVVVCDSLNHFLTTLCLQEAFFGIRNCVSVNGTNNILETIMEKEKFQPLWLNGEYIYRDDLNNFYMSEDRDILIWGNWIGFQTHLLLDIFDQNIDPKITIKMFGVDLPRRYWTKFSEWKAEWLLDEENASIRRILIEQLGYEEICDKLGAVSIDSWQEYTLLKLDNMEIIYEGQKEIRREPMLLLKMTCPSTNHIHILRVPPEMTSAEAAITWVNHGIHPDEFAVQT
jgi:hypothetical protein